MTFKFLSKGDVVDVIFPGTAGSFAELEKIKNYLKNLGLVAQVFLEKETTLKKSETHEFPSFNAAKRFAQFEKALNSDSKIIWCARGGYGSAELLPLLMKMKKPTFRKAQGPQKIFIGFSDISALNIFLIQKWQCCAITAPMLAQIALEKVSKKSSQAISDFIFGKKKELKYQLKKISGSAVAPLSKIITGGCLSVLSSHFGTKNQINWKGKILFLEDEGEDGERLDRYFYQLVTIMVEQKKLPAAIVLGNFLQANPHGTPKAKNIEIAIKKFAEKLAENKLEIPLFIEKTKCLGHSKDMLPLVLGAQAKITSNNFLIQNF